MGNSLLEKICFFKYNIIMKKEVGLNAESAYAAVLKILNRADKTEAEIRKKLKEKGFSYSDVSAAVVRAKNNGLINDARYADLYFEFNKERKGSRRIRLELERKGIDGEIIKNVLMENDEDSACLDVALRFARNKTRDEKFVAKLMRHLAARGFEYGAIKKAVAAVADGDENGYSDGAED